MEAWNTVPDYPKYQVSDLGNVRGPRGTITPYLDRDGRPTVNLYNWPHQRKFRVSRLVLVAFKGQCPEGMEGCHSNGDPSDNCLTNLRWDTKKSNAADKIKHGTGLGPKYATRGRRKLTDEQVLQIREEYDGTESFTSIGKRYGMSYRSISLLLEGRTWAHLGGS